MTIQIKTAKKEHRCTICGRRIPAGARYWGEYNEQTDRREHTNCLDYEAEPQLPEGFNKNRSSYKKGKAQ